EDGIRGFHVTGVQTCALPILLKCILPKNIPRILIHIQPHGQKIFRAERDQMLDILNANLLVLAQGEFYFFSAQCQYQILWAVDGTDRKSTRLNSSHVKISYAVFCLKKKTQHAQV